MEAFEQINKGFNTTFKPNKLSLGLVVPLEVYPASATPTMHEHIARVQLAEELGFSAIWLRDIPFNVPSFNDAGQMFDPFVYLGFLAAQTKSISLGVGSIILPLRHPAHVAKAAASIDVLSGGRLILGVASGDRAEEYPALGVEFVSRGERFREAYEYITRMWEQNPMFESEYGSPYGGLDMLPKPTAHKVPLLITGASQQDREWLATHGDGWLTYPRSVAAQAKFIDYLREHAKMAGELNKPVSQSLYIDLVDDPHAKATPIHLGFRIGSVELTKLFKEYEAIGVNHVALNLRLNNADVVTTMKRLADEVLPHFA